MLDVVRREKATRIIKYVNILNLETVVSTATIFGLRYWRMILAAKVCHYCIELGSLYQKAELP